MEDKLDTLWDKFWTNAKVNEYKKAKYSDKIDIERDFQFFIWKEAQEELLEEIKQKFILLKRAKEFDNWVKREFPYIKK